MANNIVRTVKLGSVFESAKAVIDATITIDQGQHVYFDDTNNLIKAVTAEAQCATYLGLMPVKIVLGKLVSPYNTDTVAAGAIADIPGPQFGVIANCTLKTGDSISPGDLVYADPATAIDGVTVSGTKAIGIYQGKAVSSAAAGTKVEVLIGHRHPGDVLAGI